MREIKIPGPELYESCTYDILKKYGIDKEQYESSTFACYKINKFFYDNREKIKDVVIYDDNLTILTTDFKYEFKIYEEDTYIYLNGEKFAERSFRVKIRAATPEEVEWSREQLRDRLPLLAGRRALILLKSEELADRAWVRK
ncbi:MAG: hypothetical protein GX951_04630 [Mollicutes bacterium]|nr:hypothetical protein [Mollicutes bacterium]